MLDKRTRTALVSQYLKVVSHRTVFRAESHVYGCNTDIVHIRTDITQNPNPEVRFDFLTQYQLAISCT